MIRAAATHIDSGLFRFWFHLIADTSARVGTLRPDLWGVS